MITKVYHNHTKISILNAKIPTDFSMGTFLFMLFRMNNYSIISFQRLLPVLRRRNVGGYNSKDIGFNADASAFFLGLTVTFLPDN